MTTKRKLSRLRCETPTQPLYLTRDLRTPLWGYKVGMGASRLRFDADLSRESEGFGAPQWCRKMGAVEDECVAGLVAGVSRTLERRLSYPSTMLDEAAESSKWEVFDSLDSCTQSPSLLFPIIRTSSVVTGLLSTCLFSGTDNHHVKGRCMLLRSLTRYIVEAAIPGDF